MKRLIIALMLLLIGGGMCMTQAQTTDTKVDKKAEKAAKKAVATPLSNLWKASRSPARRCSAAALTVLRLQLMDMVNRQ